jgi:hypothetical protein
MTQEVDVNNPMYGRKHSEETKERIRLLKLGDRNPNFGKHRSPETIEKIRLSIYKRRQERV